MITLWGIFVQQIYLLTKYFWGLLKCHLTSLEYFDFVTAPAKHFALQHNASLVHPLTSGTYNSNHACVPRADTFNTCCSLSNNVIVKELLKLVHICESWDIILCARFFETQCICYMHPCIGTFHSVFWTVCCFVAHLLSDLQSYNYYFDTLWRLKLQNLALISC